MKRLVSFFLLFTGLLFANSTAILPILANNSIVTDELVANFKRPIKVEDLRSIKYSQEDLNTDVLNSCNIPEYAKDIKNKAVFDIVTNYNASQIGVIYYASCTDLSKNDYVIVNNNEISTGKTIMVYYQIIPQLGRVVVSSQEVLQKDIKNLCKNKSFRDFVNHRKNIAMFIYTNKDKTAFSIYLFNHCPAQ